MGLRSEAMKAARFLFFDSTVPGIHHLQPAKPPVFLVSRGTLHGPSAVKTLDAFAYLLARAAHNFELTNTLGEHAVRLQKQGTADFRAMETLQRAGFSPEAALAVLPKISLEQDAIFSSSEYKPFFAPTPDPSDQVLVITAGLARVVKRLGHVRQNTTSLKPLQQLLSIIEQESFADPLEAFIDSNRLEKLEPIRQLEILTCDVLKQMDPERMMVVRELCRHLTNINLADCVSLVRMQESWENVVANLPDFFDEAAAENVDASLGSLSEDFTPSELGPFKFADKKTERVVNQFLTAVFDLARNGHLSAFMTVYEAATVALGVHKAKVPIGPLVKVDRLLKELPTHVTAEGLHNTIEELLTTAKQDKAISASLMELNHFVMFQGFPEYKIGEPVPWQPMINALESATERQRDAIIEVLWGLNIQDPRAAAYNPELAWELMHDAKEGTFSLPLSYQVSSLPLMTSSGVAVSPRRGSTSNAIDPQKEMDAFVFRRLEQIANTLHKNPEDEKALHQLHLALDFDHTAYLADTAKRSGGKLAAPDFITHRPDLFLELNRKTLESTSGQRTLIKAIKNMLEIRGGEASMHRFYSTLMESEMVRGIVSSNMPFKGNYSASPLLRFSLDHLNQILSSTTRWDLLASSGVIEAYYLNSTAWGMEEFLAKTVRPLLHDILQEKSGAEYPNDLCENWADLHARLKLLQEHSVGNLDLVANLEAQVLLDDTAATVSDLVQLQRSVNIFGASHSSLRQKITSTFEGSPILSENVKISVYEWKALHSLRLFASDDIAYEALWNIVPKLRAAAEPIRITLVEHLLFENPDLKQEDSPIYDTLLVNELISLWASGLSRTFHHGRGEDDGSPEAFAEGRAIAQRIAQHSPSLYMKNWFEALANGIVSQPELTNEIRKEVSRVSDDLMEGSSSFHSLNPDLQKCLLYNKTVRRTTMEFLLSRGADTDQKIYAAQIISILKLLGEDLLEINLPSAREIQSWAGLAHRLFRQDSIEQQALMVTKLLAPPYLPDPDFQKNGAVAPSAVEAREAIQMILSRAIPTDVATAGLGEYISAYLEGLDRYERLYMATLFLHCENQRREQVQSLGYSLGLVSKECGPFETWIAQNASTSEFVDESIRTGIAAANIKTRVNQPVRTEGLPWIKNVIPEEQYADFNRFGLCLGSGKIWVTWDVTSGEYGSEAVQLRRPDALSLIEAGASKWVAGISQMNKRQLSTSMISNLLPTAYRSCIDEANVRLSPMQFDLAHQIIHERQIQILGKQSVTKFSFITPKLIDFGETASGHAYRRMTQLPGEHFIDLERMSFDPAYIEASAIACHTLFLSHLFAAKGHNRDVHGGNNRLLGGIIGCFDFGGMYLDKISDIEIAQFSELYFRALLSTKLNSNFPEQLLFEAQLLQYEEQLLPFTQSALQSCLSMADYTTKLSARKLLSSVAGAYSASTTHPVTREVVDNLLGESAVASGFIVEQQRFFEKMLTSPRVVLK